VIFQLLNVAVFINLELQFTLLSCFFSDYLQRLGKREEYSSGNKLAVRVAVHLRVWKASSVSDAVASGKLHQLLSST